MMHLLRSLNDDYGLIDQFEALKTVKGQRRVSNFPKVSNKKGLVFEKRENER